MTCIDDAFDWSKHAPLTSLPTAELGTIPGVFEVSAAGAATYSMPIDIPKGVGGLQPSLSVSYDSDNGNGLLGVGFSLSGFSVISPCGANYAQDGHLEPVDIYYERAPLCLDGKRLVPVDPYNAEFRTYPDTFSKIRLVRKDAGDPIGVRVWTKDGLIIDYGIVAELPDDLETAIVWNDSYANIKAWLARRVTDRFGNTIVYTYNHVYDESSSTGHRPTLEYGPGTIVYGQRTIRFGYEESSRPDPSHGYFAGQKSQLTRRLSKIGIEHRGLEVYNYQFSYGQSLASGRSQLSSVRECVPESPAKCKPATTFHFARQEMRLSEPTVLANAPSYEFVDRPENQIISMDLDGDGNEDFVYLNEKRDASSYQKQWVFALSKGDGTFSIAPGPWEYAEPGGMLPEVYSTQEAVPSDFNHDGKMELLLTRFDPHYVTWWTFLKPDLTIDSNRNLVSARFVPIQSNAKMGLNARLIDADGDGDLDIIQCRNTASDLSWELRLNVPSSDPDGTTLWDIAIPVDDMDPEACRVANNDATRVVDYDGDGATEILAARINDGGAAIPYKLILNTLDPAGSTMSAVSWPLSLSISNIGRSNRLIDINGDGLEDFIGVGTVRLNKQYDFAAPTSIPGISQIEISVPVDLDGDGRMDLISRSVSNDDMPWNGYWSVVRSPDTGPRLEGIGLPKGTRSVQRIAYNGHPSAGLVVVETNPKDPRIHTHISLYKNEAVAPDLLTGIDTGITSDGTSGVAIGIQYMPLTESTDPPTEFPEDEAFYRRGTCASSAETCVAGTKRVVSRYQIKRSGDLQDSYLLRYRNARYHTMGYGWLGFAERMVRRNETFETRTHYQNSAIDGSYQLVGEINDEITLSGAGLARLDANAPCEAHASYTHREAIATHNGKSYYVSLSEKRDVAADQVLCLAPDLMNDTRSYDTSTRYPDARDAFGNPEYITAQSNLGSASLQRLIYKTTYQASADAGGDDSIPWAAPSATDITECSSELGVEQCRQEHVDYTNGIVSSRTIAPGSSAHQLKTDYTRDSRGNVIQIDRITAADPLWGDAMSRRSCVSYDPVEGIVPTSYTNAAGQITHVKADPVTGNILMTADPNNLVSKAAYDGFGRLTRTRGPDGTGADHELFTNSGSTWPDRPVHSRTLRVGAGGESQEVLEILNDRDGRPVRRSWYLPRPSGAGQRVFEELAYDGFGNLQRVSVPTAEGQLPTEYMLRHYDDWGRLKESFDRGRTTRYDYSRRTVTITEQGATPHVRVVERDEFGRTASVKTSATSSTAATETKYSYGPFDRIATVTDPSGHQATFDSEAYGHHTSSSDPDRGARSADKNPFGEIIQTRDAVQLAAGTKSTIIRDVLGRPMSRTDPGYGTSTWSWDPPNALGHLDATSSPSGARVKYEYDALVRPYRETQTVRGSSYLVSKTYDPVWGGCRPSRIRQDTDPSRSSTCMTRPAPV